MGKRKAQPNRQVDRGARTTVAVFGSIIVLLALIVGAVAYFNRGPGSDKTEIDPASQSPTVGIAMPNPPEKGVHINPPQRGHWTTDPPTSGEHYNAQGLGPLQWGFYAQAQQPEGWVHNLEHGGVAILFKCGDQGCSDEQSKVQSFIAGAAAEKLFHEVKLVGTPYPIPGHHYALVAWGYVEWLESWDDQKATDFYRSHVDHGPEVIP